MTEDNVSNATTHLRGVVQESGLSESNPRSNVDSRVASVEDEVEDDPNCCEKKPDEVGTIRNVTIKQLNYGYIVDVGCHKFAFESAEKLVRYLADYLKNPNKTENEWFSGTLIRCDKCFQMTNHLNGVCQKCKKVIPYVPPEELYRAPVI